MPLIIQAADDKSWRVRLCLAKNFILTKKILMFNFFKKKKKSNFDSDKFDWLLNESTLIFHSGESLLHYFNSETKKDLQNPAWQNQGIYFWREDENFEKKISS